MSTPSEHIERQVASVEAELLHPKRRCIERLVRSELTNAIDTYKPYNSAHEIYVVLVLLEEVEDLLEEARAKAGMKSRKKMAAEAIQVAAVAQRFLVDLIDEETLQAIEGGA